jgi:flagellar motor switch protein FliN
MESLDKMAATENDECTDATARAGKAKGKPVVALNASILGDVDVTLSAILGRGSIPVRRLLELSVGDAVELDTPLNGVLDLTLNGKTVARGELVAVEDKFGVRITEIIAE